MSFGFGKRSTDNLVGVHPNMIKVAERAIAISTQDFFVNEGVRTMERQKSLYAQGRTKPGPKVTWTLQSNHFKKASTGFGHAVDIYPHPYIATTASPAQQKVFAGKQRIIALAMLRAADELDIPIRWGADWDMDGKFGERGEGDSPHFELWGQK